MHKETLYLSQLSQLSAYQVFHLNVFSQQAYQGNSATVVWRSNGLDTRQMQLLAREFNTPESIFIHLDNNGLSLRFFTPDQEVPACGHGTIAAAHVANNILCEPAKNLVFSTAAGNVMLRQTNAPYAEYKFAVPVPKLEAVLDPPKSIVDAIAGLAGVMNRVMGEGNIIGKSYRVKSASGQSRLLIHCENEAQLLSLNPDFPRLSLALKALALFSVFVFSINNKTCSHLSGRMFSPGIGINEDAVNGNSSAALAGVIDYICKNNNLNWR